MRKTTLFLMLTIVLGGIAMTSCADKKPEASKAATEAGAKSAGNLPNYRYVDLDTILSRYNLAKDYNEQMLSMQNNAESTMRQKENSLNSAASAFQKKYQNSTYLSKEDQEAAQREQQRLANMQSSAQQEMAKLQNDIMNAADEAQKTVIDSINAFIKDYNAKRGYDAILFKAATLYINPALDITDEVVEGLNARYNKMKK